MLPTIYVLEQRPVYLCEVFQNNGFLFQGIEIQIIDTISLTGDIWVLNTISEEVISLASEWQNVTKQQRFY